MGDIEPGSLTIKFKSLSGDTLVLENPKQIGKEWKIDNEYLDKISMLAEKVSEHRGRILTKCINIEDTIAQMIKIYLFGKKITEETKLFEDVILNTSFFSLSKKWNVLKEILKTEKFKGRDFSILSKNVQEAIRKRNRFAHGTIIYRGEKFYIQYFSNGKKEDELNDTYFEKTLISIQNAFRDLTLVEQEMINSVEFPGPGLPFMSMVVSKAKKQK